MPADGVHVAVRDIFSVHLARMRRFQIRLRPSHERLLERGDRIVILRFAPVKVICTALGSLNRARA